MGDLQQTDAQEHASGAIPSRNPQPLVGLTDAGGDRYDGCVHMWYEVPHTLRAARWTGCVQNQRHSAASAALLTQRADLDAGGATWCYLHAHITGQPSSTGNAHVCQSRHDSRYVGYRDPAPLPASRTPPPPVAALCRSHQQRQLAQSLPWALHTPPVLLISAPGLTVCMILLFWLMELPHTTRALVGPQPAFCGGAQK